MLSSVDPTLTELTMDSSESLSYHCIVSARCQVLIQEWFVISSGIIQVNVDIRALDLIELDDTLRRVMILLVTERGTREERA